MISPERFQEIQELFRAAVSLPPSDQEAFLRDKCLDDETLRQEIESLLAEDARCSGFLQTGSGASAAPALMLATGTRLGPYEIRGIIGTGGKGEVYRAHDTRLCRDVALKVLPQSFANDHERITRFRREAQLLAALNHPNVASIYGLEESNGAVALVMELVEGQTLAERITSEALRIEEALRVAKQIADALEAAHERGIVHRDLKPANVKITPEGVVKVLDFGLGKVLKPDGSPTASRSGVILGTASYMSPEQARGAAIDKRADIWAFGVVLCEILMRRPPFTGETTPDILASVVKDEPDHQRLADPHGGRNCAVPEQGAAQSMGKHGRCPVGVGRIGGEPRFPCPYEAHALPSVGRLSDSPRCCHNHLAGEVQPKPTAHAYGDHSTGRYDARTCRMGPTCAVSGWPATGLYCNE
jgi:serine/threonine protein kinase